MHLSKRLSSTLMHESVDQRILTIWGYLTKSLLSGHGYQVCMFDVLIKRPIEIDLENNGDDHRNKLETKHTHTTNTI